MALSPPSCRRRGSTVQGTDKRTKTQSEGSPGGRRRHDLSDAPILGAIAASIDRLRDADGPLNTHAAPGKTH